MFWDTNSVVKPQPNAWVALMDSGFLPSYETWSLGAWIVVTLLVSAFVGLNVIFGASKSFSLANSIIFLILLLELSSGNFICKIAILTVNCVLEECTQRKIFKLKQQHQYEMTKQSYQHHCESLDETVRQLKFFERCITREQAEELKSQQLELDKDMEEVNATARELIESSQKSAKERDELLSRTLGVIENLEKERDDLSLSLSLVKAENDRLKEQIKATKPLHQRQHSLQEDYYLEEPSSKWKQIGPELAEDTEKETSGGITLHTTENNAVLKRVKKPKGPSKQK